MSNVTSVINDCHLNTQSTFGSNDITEELGYPLTPDLNFSSAHAFFSYDDLARYHKNKYGNHRYGRDSNEISSQLEFYFSKMSNDAPSLLFNSGMSALSAALAALLPKSKKVVTLGVIYRKTEHLISELCKVSEKTHVKLPPSALAIEKLASQEKRENILFVIEAPSNPFLQLVDIALIKKLFPHARILLDFTLAGLLNGSDYIGYADISVSSCTKYISGHNDLIAGVAVIQSEDLLEELWQIRSAYGTIIHPLASYMLLRSLRTYDLRIARMLETTKILLPQLIKSELIDKVFYPGITDDPHQNDCFHTYFRHGGSVITFLVDQSVNVKKVCRSFKSIKMAPSFGSVDTLYEIPRYMSRGVHGDDFEGDLSCHESLTLHPNLMRLSVGCEPIEYLLSDLSELIAQDEQQRKASDNSRSVGH